VPDFFTLTLIIFLAMLHGCASRMGTFSMVLLRLPSTLLHELAHLAVALVTFAGPTNIDIFPRRINGGWMLGCVQCERITWHNAFPVGMAPILVNLPLAWWVYRWETLSGYVLAFLLLTAALPSGQDMKVAFCSLVGAMAWLGCFGLAGRLVGWW